MKVHIATIHEGKKKKSNETYLSTNFEQNGLLNENVATVNKGNK